MTERPSEIKQEREREFHNKTFSEGTRKSLSAVYILARDPKDAFEQALLADCRSKSVLEYGCGQGTYSFTLAAKGADVIGIDISDVAIEQAAARAGERGVRARYIRMDAEDLQFAPATFDTVCGVAILHHLDLHKSFTQIARVLKPGGMAVFFEPLGHNPFINLFRRMTPRLRTPDEHPLMMADLALARQFFGRVDVRYFNLFSFGALPFRNTRLLNPVLNLLGTMDRLVFSVIPWSRRFAWQVVMVMKDPK